MPEWSTDELVELDRRRRELSSAVSLSDWQVMSFSDEQFDEIRQCDNVQVVQEDCRLEDGWLFIALDQLNDPEANRQVVVSGLCLKSKEVLASLSFDTLRQAVPLLALLIRDGITRAVTLNEPFPATIGALSSTEEDTVLRPLCSLLSTLVGNTMQTSAAQRDQLRHAACQGGVLEALISFPSGATLQGEQFSLIACLISGVDSNALARRLCYTSVPLDTGIFKALSTFDANLELADPWTLAMVLRVWTALARGPGVDRCIDASGLEAILTIMASKPGDVRVQNTGCAALLALCQGDDGRAAARRSQALAAGASHAIEAASVHVDTFGHISQLQEVLGLAQTNRDAFDTLSSSCGQCGPCGRPQTPLAHCARCMQVYCGPACQRAAWPAHKLRCSRSGLLPIPTPSSIEGASADEVFAVLREFGCGHKVVSISAIARLLMLTGPDGEYPNGNPRWVPSPPAVLLDTKFDGLMNRVATSLAGERGTPENDAHQLLGTSLANTYLSRVQMARSNLAAEMEAEAAANELLAELDLEDAVQDAKSKKAAKRRAKKGRKRDSGAAGPPTKAEEDDDDVDDDADTEQQQRQQTLETTEQVNGNTLPTMLLPSAANADGTLPPLPNVPPVVGLSRRGSRGRWGGRGGRGGRGPPGLAPGTAAQMEEASVALGTLVDTRDASDVDGLRAAVETAARHADRFPVVAEALVEAKAWLQELEETQRAAAKQRHMEELDEEFERVQLEQASSQGASSSTAPAAAIDVEIPDEFICPITSVLMEDPVFTVDGLTYERSAIEQWLQHKVTSPMTGSPLASTQLIPNVSLRGMIRKFTDHHPGLRA